MGSIALPKGYKKLGFLPGIGIIIGIILIAVGATSGTSNTPPSPINPIPAQPGGAVSPAFNTIPGPVTITNVQPATGSPGVLISFSAGGDCGTCQAVFDLAMTYSDKTTDNREVTTGIYSGAVFADYSPNIRPLPPGPVQISITGFSINPMVSGSQGPISQPYTITV